MGTIISSFNKATTAQFLAELRHNLAAFAASRGIIISVDLGDSDDTILSFHGTTSVQAQDNQLPIASLDVDVTQEFIRRAGELHNNRRGSDLRQVGEQEDQLWQEIMDFQRTLSRGVCVGKILNLEVPDGMAHYLIVGLGKRVLVEHLPLGEALVSASISETGSIATDRAARLVQQQEKMADACRPRNQRAIVPPAPVPSSVGRKPYNKGSLRVKLRYGKLLGQMGQMEGDTFKPNGKEFQPAMIVEKGTRPNRQCLAVTEEMLKKGVATQVGSDIILVMEKHALCLRDK